MQIQRSPMMTTQFSGKPQHPSKLKKIAQKVALGLALTAPALGMVACSPQQNSYWNGTFTNLPNPPANARLQLGVSTESDGTVFINYVVWENGKFIRKDIHYSTTAFEPGTFSEMGGYKQNIRNGEVLYGDAIVDQANKRIKLSDGNFIDGPSGNIVDSDGKVVQKFGE